MSTRNLEMRLPPFFFFLNFFFPEFSCSRSKILARVWQYYHHVASGIVTVQKQCFLLCSLNGEQHFRECLDKERADKLNIMFTVC